MKKLLAMALALVMALGVTTISWAEGVPTLSNGVWSNVTKDNVQALLDGEYGNIDNTTIVLSAGDYNKLELRAAIVGTKYTCPHNDSTDNTGPVTFDTVDEYKSHMSDKPHHGDARVFTRTISNLTISAQDGANVAGLDLLSRTYDGDQDPFVSEKTGYRVVFNVTGLTFSNVNFTGSVVISSKFSEDTSISGVTFENCKFTTGGTATGNGQAINYSNDLNNGKVKDLVVKDCEFKNCYQGVYTNGITNVTVKNNAFDTIGHNAVAIQSPTNASTNHGNVVITENYFNNVTNRVFRFNKAGEGTNVTINNNVMVNSGDENGELFKATTIAEGASANLENNYWSGRDAAKAVANESVRPSKIGVTGGTFSVDVTDYMADGYKMVPNGDGTYTVKKIVHYYYNPTTDTKVDETKGSPKTFDAGVGIYAVTAVLSVTGMAWVGKKRH
jgi:hypothetical protein